MASRLAAVTVLLSAISLFDVLPALLQMCMISHLHAIHFANRFFQIVDCPCKIKKKIIVELFLFGFSVTNNVSAGIGFTVEV